MKNKIMLVLIAFFLSISLLRTSTFANSNGPTPNLIIQTQDHVNIYSGAVSFFLKEFLTASQGPQLALSLNYNSQSDYSGMFGYNWRSAYDIALTRDNQGNVTIFKEDSGSLVFIERSGTFTISKGNFYKLAQNSDGTFTLTDQNGTVTNYGPNGRMISQIDSKGNTLKYVYNPSQFDGTYVQDAQGDHIDLNFDIHDRIASAVDNNGRAYQYNYDTNGNLISIITGAQETDYDYDAHHQIVQITNGLNHNTYYQYDDMGRVIETWKDTAPTKITLEYVGNNTTVVTDSSGKHTYMFDDNGSLEFSDVSPQSWGVKMEEYD